MKGDPPSYKTEFNDASNVSVIDLLSVERDGLSLAHAGIHNGSNAGHLAMLGSDKLPTSRRGKDDRDDALDIILSTIPYEQKLFETYQRLGDAEDGVDRLIESAARHFDTEQTKLDDLEAQAAQTADGTRVARSDQDGHIYAIETGCRISDEDAATIIWRGDEPSLETIDAQRERADQAHDTLERARGKEARLGDLREELSDGKPSRERLNDIQDEIAGIVQDTQADLEIISAMPMNSTVREVEFDVSNTVMPQM